MEQGSLIYWSVLLQNWLQKSTDPAPSGPCACADLQLAELPGAGLTGVWFC